MDDPMSVTLGAIAAVAPDADLDALRPDDDLRDAVGLDSTDFLNVVIAIHERAGIEIPERDYPRLTTLRTFAEYLAKAGETGESA